MQTKERQAGGDERKKGVQGSVYFHQLACQCFTAHFYPLLTLWWNAGVKKTLEQSLLLGNTRSKQILMPSGPFGKLKTPKGQMVYSRLWCQYILWHFAMLCQCFDSVSRFGGGNVFYASGSQSQHAITGDKTEKVNACAKFLFGRSRERESGSQGEEN